MNKVTKILIISIFVLIVGFIPFKKKSDDYTVIIEHRVNEDVSCTCSLFFQYHYEFLGRYNSGSAISMRKRYTVLGLIVVQETNELVEFSLDGQELVPYEEDVIVPLEV
jgi:hypothetical protein